MPLILPARTLDSGYTIDNSLRFNDDDSPRLNITPSAGNRKTWTFSCWLKRSNTGTYQRIFSAYDSSDDEHLIFRNTDQLHFYSGDATIDVKTNAVYRDPSAWYHIVCAVDTTDGTAANRVKLYINGVQETSFATATYPSADADTGYNENVAHDIGRSSTDAQYFDGYMSDVYFIDGTQYAASDFGETDEDSGIWKPKDASVTFGTNGFKLEFQQTGTGTASASTIGADTSGNTNHLTSTNLAATDVTVDTPTNNFCTLNSLTAGTYPELREGNLQQYEHGSSDSSGVAATMMPINGKWYAELYLNAPSAGDYPMLGITDTINLNQKGAGGSKMAAGFEIDGVTNNQSTNNLGTITNTNTGWPTFADNDIVMFALDCDNRKLWIGRQGTWINSGDPAGESNHQLSWTVDANVCPFLLGYDNSQSGGGADESIWNYGNPPFAISSSQADDNGYGNFEHDVPTGFYALCTKNLAEYG